MAAHRTATVLKIRNGSGEHNPSRLRDESKIAPRGTPTVPPWVTLTPEAQSVFDYLLKEFVLPAVHGTKDGALMCQLAEEVVLYERANRSITTVGALTKNHRGMPIPSPYVRIRRDSADRIVRLMNELGFSPSGRLKFAPPLNGGRMPDFASWDALDV